MKYVDEYRGEAEAQQLARAIARLVTRPWTLMEICGGQTHTLVKYGIDHLLPPQVTLVHGPGCPVCVTPVALIDQAIDLARRPGLILTSFGDMLRVPGSQSDLLSVKAQGGDVRMVYSPLDAVRLAQRSPEREVVFFAVGFETTAPANAMAVRHAARLGLRNFSILSSHVLVPPAVELILGDPEPLVQGFLAAGHVCAVMGYWEYEPLAERFRTPIVVTGFEPLDLLRGIHETLRMLERGEWGVSNQYARAVTRAGNLPAQAILREIFEPCDRAWRGIGVIAQSGLRLRPAYAHFDAAQRFEMAGDPQPESSGCIAGRIMQGRARPPECPLFGTLCTPERPAGAPMVSSEGACAAYYLYRRDQGTGIGEPGREAAASPAIAPSNAP